jgi:hypothetical protein
MSVIRVDNFGPSAGGTTYSARGIAKAWVDLDGTGTAAIQDSNNISSISDNGTGNYTSNFTNSFSSNAFSLTASGNQTRDTGTGSWGFFVGQQARTASYSRVQCFNDGYGTFDLATVNASAHGDLA